MSVAGIRRHLWLAIELQHRRRRQQKWLSFASLFFRRPRRRLVLLPTDRLSAPSRATDSTVSSFVAPAHSTAPPTTAPPERLGDTFLRLKWPPLPIGQRSQSGHSERPNIQQAAGSLTRLSGAGRSCSGQMVTIGRRTQAGRPAGRRKGRAGGNRWPSRWPLVGAQYAPTANFHPSPVPPSPLSPAPISAGQDVGRFAS